MRVKDKSYNSLEGQQFYQKGTPTQVFSCEYSECFRDSFFIEQHRWLAAFELSLSTEKNFKERKLLERLIAFALIGLFHVQIQEPANKSTNTRAIVCQLSLNFIITK